MKEETAQTAIFCLCPCCRQALKITGTENGAVFDPVSGEVCSLVAANDESLTSLILPGWPLAERGPHECEWPRFAGHPPSAREKKND